MTAIFKMYSKTHQNFKVLQFQRNWCLEDFRPEECDSDKCDLKMAAIAAIMVAILAVIFNMVAKTHKKLWSAPVLQLQRKLIFRWFLEECDRDQCDFKMAVILVAIFKIDAKMRKISKCPNFNENWYVVKAIWKWQVIYV